MWQWLNNDTATPPIQKTVKFGFYILATFGLTVGLWAYFAPLESAAIARGKIIVAGNRLTIQHLEGGIVRDIDIKEGTQVQANQLLIKLDDTRAQVALNLARNNVIELQAAQTRIQSELTDQSVLVFSDELLADAKAINALPVLENEKKIFTVDQQTFKSNLSILQQRIAQLIEQRQGTSAQEQASANQLVLIQKELKDVRILAQKRLIQRSQLLALERDAENLSGSKGQYQASMAAIDEKIGETKLQINSMTEKRQQDLLNDLHVAQQKLSDGLERLKAAQDVFNRTAIRAPQAGTVMDLKIHTIGGVVQPGEALMDIVPKNPVLMVEAEINPTDIDVVHANLMAKVNLSPFKTRTMPPLWGEVTQVSADAFTNPVTHQLYYRAQISLTIPNNRAFAAVRLTPGMPVEVMIITNKLTPWDYFAGPIKRSLGKAFTDS